MILNNQYYKIIMWLTTYVVGITAPNATYPTNSPLSCAEICPPVPMDMNVPVLPPPMGVECPSVLTLGCGVGYLVEIACSNPNTFTINDLYCIEDPNFVTDPPQPPPCPTASSSTGTTDTVLIVVIVLLAVVLLLSWAGFLLLWHRKRKPPATLKKEAGNHYTPTPKKPAKEKKKKEKMSMSARPPLPNPRPRPTNGEAAQTQAEYDYIDPSTIGDDDPNAYLEMVE
ncbi:uncharacterized protein LOC117124125 isoform X2 [Anneissia japonica]|uniref:uncharacterized protein LOC117124125 isoform X2 n=1 Tax=Anneissia japonica TaxID=1529436 RepID=UPI001425B1F1|nr:uncharacterized protein LOC117124125 isoform X2 [Anneissia japonica]